MLQQKGQQSRKLELLRPTDTSKPNIIELGKKPASAATDLSEVKAPSRFPNPVDQITAEIFIGNFIAARDPKLLSQLGIRSILCLNNSLEQISAESLGVENVEVFNLADGPGNDLGYFERIVDTLQRLTEKHAPVLVSCHAGKSRSAAVVAAYLKQRERLEVEEAIARVAEKRIINITPSLLRLLEKM